MLTIELILLSRCHFEHQCPGVTKMLLLRLDSWSDCQEEIFWIHLLSFPSLLYFKCDHQNSTKGKFSVAHEVMLESGWKMITDKTWDLSPLMGPIKI